MDNSDSKKEVRLALAGIAIGALFSLIGNFLVTSSYRYFNDSLTMYDDGAVFYFSLIGFLGLIALLYLLVFWPWLSPRLQQLVSVFTSFRLPKWDYFQIVIISFIIFLIMILHCIACGVTIP
ncbi:hypothetical protein [Methanolobus sp. ZRKC5]|uniref:hypothetical protein n=1 Tax=unclassified Methanolobus TaxID=2629569 RepID=UPI00313B40F8